MFANDDEPDRTIDAAGEWFRTGHHSDRRVGPVIDPRLEHVFAALDVVIDDGDGLFTVVNGGLGAIIDTRGFPQNLTFWITGHIHWRKEDLGLRHRLSAAITPLSAGTKRVNRAKNTTILEEPLTPSDRWHHPNGVLPTVFGLAMAPVFLSTGEHLLNFSIDGHHAAEMPFDVEAVDAPDTSQAVPAPL
ncbi:hypothetical protein HYG77_20465 [Rhodococcus sp. ZPP]|uniref:hypothetical protein n=1 Tax=Rhodococcus sp. ZPP TaxID=2749906 RepID=UPI001AD872BB|nr:hypothetical protein [Rhodococcus sp. ZPP]QTJ67732.1 hypothetical protein HYG77_20465 [Rhodococcus sp. ZPP]